MAGMFTLYPTGGIPGTPAIVVLLALPVSVQLMAHRPCFGLHRRLLRSSVDEDSLLFGRRYRPDGLLAVIALVLGGLALTNAGMTQTLQVPDSTTKEKT